MLINWFTVIAQLINFLILVALLKRFLFKPVLRAIDEREKNIAAQIEDARNKETEAAKQQTVYLEKNKLFDQQRNGLMNEAIAAAAATREELLEKVRIEAQTLEHKFNSALEEKQEHFSNEFIRRARTEVFAVARKSLQELADSQLEEQMVTVFTDRLKNCTTVEREKIIQAFGHGSGVFTVQSVYNLSVQQQEKISKALQEITGEAPVLHFETTPDLVSGIELGNNGYKITWSITAYLEAMIRQLKELSASVSVSEIHTADEQEKK